MFRCNKIKGSFTLCESDCNWRQVIGYIPYECWLGATMTLEFFAFNRKLPAYPEFGDATLKCALWTFKQQLALNIRVHYGISIVLLQTSLYCAFRDTKWQCVINGFTGVKKDYLQWDSTWWSLDQESNIYLSALTWHVLVRRSSNWLLFMYHFTFWT